eukprot:TRINITY_DN18968_c0_g1_i1.p1 TRINITY_DN18968_c0_g1~~TRINITY_DN18968_c0_g1_i1.p1  ORF type:complete len:156 (-),score=25.39 TRINITY_DN18968_c0_g1_i1:169-636(-)
MSKGQDKFLQATTLSGLLQSCRGKRTTIELRNEAYVTGKVVDVDGFMNVKLEAATMLDPAGNTINFDNFYVQNKLVRYVQIPENIDIKQALIQLTEPSAGRGRGRGRGGGPVSKMRQKLLDKRESRRQEDIRNALKMKEKEEKNKASAAQAAPQK